MSYTLRAKRTLAGAASGAMILALVPASMAAADTEAVCENAPEDAFTDVNPGGAHSDNIDCIAAYGITTGSANEGEYDPWGAVSRGQMGSFLHEFLEVADAEEYPVPATTSFDDVEGTTHENGIKVIEEQGITTGTAGGDSYEPRAPVTRGQMATFVAETIEVLGGELDANPPNAFADDDGTTHEEAIDQLAAAGVVSGRLDGTFGPNDTITRAQMASYLAEAAGFLDDQGEWHSTLEAPEEPVTSNQTFTVTPADEANNSASLATNDSGAREYSVSGLADGTTYNVALVPAENVTVTDGTVSFVDAGNDNIADGVGGTTASIEEINGTATDGDDKQTATSVDGVITFQVDSIVEESVTPVVWLDAETTADNALDVDDDGLPTEDFGIGGDVNWIPTEAADDAPAADTEITSVNKTGNYIVAGGATYYYSSADTFQIATAATSGAGVGDGASTCSAVSQSAFVAALSTGDELDQGTDYENENDGVDTGASTFCLEDLTPPVVTNVTAVRTGDTDADVTFDEMADVDSYNVYRAMDEAADVAFADGDFTLVGSVDAADDSDAGSTNTFEDTGLTASTTYTYVVTSVVDGDESAASTESETTTLAAGSVAAPIAELTFLDVDGGVFAGDFGTGDTFTVVFDEAIADITDGGDTEAMRVEDGDGDFADLVCGTEITCAQNANSEAIGSTTYAPLQILEATYNAAPTVLGTGDGTLDYPLTITNVNSGWDDGADDPTLNWDLAASTDVTIDADGDTDASASSAAPIITNATLTSNAGVAPAAGDDWGDEVNDELTLTLSETVTSSTLTDGDALTEAQLESILGVSVTYATNTVVTITDVDNDDVTIVLTLTGAALDAGTVVDGTTDVPGTINNLLESVADGDDMGVNGTPDNDIS